MSTKTRSSDRRRIHLLGWFAAFMLFLAPVPALADPLDGPRDAGIVGERADGYAEIRDSGRATSQIKGMVQQINQQRRAFYQKKANQQDIPVEAVGKIYAKAIYEKAPAGWWFRDDTGQWKQK